MTRINISVMYLDTSFVAPLFLREDTSGEVEGYVRTLPADELAVSRWTVVEFSALVARKVRMAELTAKDAAGSDRRFEIAIGDIFAVLLPDAEDFAVARGYVRRPETGLRAPDALHLAIAANRKARIILTLDRKLITAGNLLGLPIYSGI